MSTPSTAIAEYRSWNEQTVRYYVGSLDSPRQRLLVGPFVKPLSAERQLPFTRALVSRVNGMPLAHQLLIVEHVAEGRWNHPAGELMYHFPTTALQVDTLPPDTVEYWRSEHEPELVRWVAFDAEAPHLVVFQGQVRPHAGEGDKTAVRNQAERVMPDHFGGIKRVVDITGEHTRETPGDTPHRLISRPARFVDVGMLAVDPRDHQVKPITYARTVLEDELHDTFKTTALNFADTGTTVSFDKFGEPSTRLKFNEHALVNVLDVYGSVPDFERGYELPPDRWFDGGRKAKLSAKTTESQVPTLFDF